MLSIYSRQSALIAAKRAGVPISQMAMKALASQADRFALHHYFSVVRIPDDKDNNDFEGHRLGENFNFLIDKANGLEGPVRELKNLQEQQRQVIESSGGGTINKELRALFDKSSAQKHDLSLQIGDLTKKLACAKHVFAVDAPDGSSDFEHQRELEEVNQFIDFAAGHQDLDAVLHHHIDDRIDHARAQKILAVDAPDGTPDDEIKRELKEVNQFIDFAREHEDIEEILHHHLDDKKYHAQAQKILAVDAPDGTPDYEIRRGVAEVKQLIDFAAEHEDIAEVVHHHLDDKKDHVQAQKILAVDAPDGTSDYEAKLGLAEVNQLIDFAAEHEDIAEVVHHHLDDKKDHVQAQRIFAVDAPDGTPDDEVRQGLAQANQFVDFAAEHENIEEVIHHHLDDKKYHAQAQKILAVDAPDGTPDDEVRRGLAQVNQFVDFAAEHEDIEKVIHHHLDDKKEYAEAHKVFGVDAPDGTPDNEIKRGLAEVDQIIEFASEHEDIEEVIRQHEDERNTRLEARKVIAVDSPDGFADFELQEGMKQVQELVDYAADHEDIYRIKKQHDLEENRRQVAAKAFAVDAPDGTADYEGLGEEGKAA